MISRNWIRHLAPLSFLTKQTNRAGSWNRKTITKVRLNNWFWKFSTLLHLWLEQQTKQRSHKLRSIFSRKKTLWSRQEAWEFNYIHAFVFEFWGRVSRANDECHFFWLSASFVKSRANLMSIACMDNELSRTPWLLKSSSRVPRVRKVAFKVQLIIKAGPDVRNWCSHFQTKPSNQVCWRSHAMGGTGRVTKTGSSQH